MYEILVDYLDEKNIQLEDYMFRAVLKSLNYKKKGYSSREANGWAYSTELIGYVGDGTANNLEDKKARKDMSALSAKVYKIYEKLNNA